MPFFHDQGRSSLRRMYVEAWRKHRESLPVEPVEDQIIRVVALHPEYVQLLESGPAALERDYTPEEGQTNPFLHMGLHLAIHEQLSTDRPAGIRALVIGLRSRWTDMHALEHQMMECLAESLWRSQRDGIPPDEVEYLDCLRRQCGR